MARPGRGPGAVAPGQESVVELQRALRVAAARRSASPGSAAGAGDAAAGSLVPFGGIRPVAAAANPGAPGPAAGLRAPVALAATAPGAGSDGIAVVAVRAVRGIFL